MELTWRSWYGYKEEEDTKEEVKNG